MDKAKKEELDKKWKSIAAKAVTDEEFKKKLVADPVGVMQESGLSLPEGAEKKVGTGNIQKVVLPANASEEIRAEAKWWEWRLDSIREFGKEDPTKKAGHLSMSSQEADDDSSGVY